MNRESRKMEHISQALIQQHDVKNHFDDIMILHNPLPNVNFEDPDFTSQMGELKTSSPLFINAMTGGAHDTKEINRTLAIAARECKLAMAVGSQMAAIKNPELKSTYSVVREVNPEGIIIANIGSEATLEQALIAIEMIRADALQIHVNVMQELIMPEGDRTFCGMLERIETIADKVGIPVIVKEVGFGMPRESVLKLSRIGVRIVDVGGFGGTNFALIENQRGGNRYPFLNDWGIPTAISLLEAKEIPDMWIIASGGIRNGLDIVKCLSIGASMVGIAGRFLKAAVNQGVEGLIEEIQELHQQMRLIMTAIGAKNLKDLMSIPLIIKGETASWCELRGISLKRYANRTPLSQ